MAVKNKEFIGAGIGAGVGGLGGYGLASLATKNKLVRLLGTLAGAGAGGYAGYKIGDNYQSSINSATEQAALRETSDRQTSQLLSEIEALETRSSEAVERARIDRENTALLNAQLEEINAKAADELAQAESLNTTAKNTVRSLGLSNAETIALNKLQSDPAFRSLLERRIEQSGPIRSLFLGNIPDDNPIKTIKFLRRLEPRLLDTFLAEYNSSSRLTPEQQAGKLRNYRERSGGSDSSYTNSLRNAAMAKMEMQKHRESVRARREAKRKIREARMEELRNSRGYR